MSGFRVASTNGGGTTFTVSDLDNATLASAFVARWCAGYTVETKDGTLDRGTQWIGWDPVKKEIRSWNFEADGGFGEGAWTKDGDNWIVKTTSVVADGSKVTATNIVSPIDGDTISVQSKDQAVDGKPIPDTTKIKMKRAM